MKMQHQSVLKIAICCSEKEGTGSPGGIAKRIELQGDGALSEFNGLTPGECMVSVLGRDLLKFCVEDKEIGPQ